MSQVWSEINKVVNCLDMKTQDGSSGTTIDSDIINVANYKALTFLIAISSTGDSINQPQVTVYAGETATGATTEMPFRYRTQVVGDGGTSGTTGSDLPSALTTTTGDGFAFSTGQDSGMYIVEVDPSDVAAAVTTGQTYDHVKLRFTNATGGDVEAQIYGVIAVLSEPRYPQAILQTAID